MMSDFTSKTKSSRQISLHLFVVCLLCVCCVFAVCLLCVCCVFVVCLLEVETSVNRTVHK